MATYELPQPRRVNRAEAVEPTIGPLNRVPVKNPTQPRILPSPGVVLMQVWIYSSSQDN